MHITVIGATGMIGSEVTAEAVRRGHAVTAASRHPAEATAATVAAVALDASDPAALKTVLAPADVAVLAVRPGQGQEQLLSEITRTVLDAGAATETRVLVVGGAAPLQIPGHTDLLVVDDPAWCPPAYRAIAVASAQQLRTCEAHRGSNWTYLSPPALIEPGERTGSFRRGTTTLLITPDGQSRISVEDFAIALVDELENPSGAARLTVAY
jgi:uncharacterized protein